jgi:hypothetical protein
MKEQEFLVDGMIMIVVPGDRYLPIGPYGQDDRVRFDEDLSKLAADDDFLVSAVMDNHTGAAVGEPHP